MSVKDDLNVADYDLVILNFARVSASSEHLPSPEQFARLIFSEGSAVIAFGDPAQNFVGLTASPFGRDKVETHRPVTWWLPVKLPVKREGGQVIRDVNSDWSFWFDNVRSYNWHFVDDPIDADHWTVDSATKGVKGAEGFAAHWEPLAQTRYGQPIGVKLEIYAFRRDRTGGVEHLATSSPVIWLHTPTEIDEKAAINLLLGQFAGMAVEKPVPDWLALFKLPRESVAEQLLAEKSQAVESLTAELEHARTSVAEELRFAKLLYEQGKVILEPVVREALAELGAVVTPPAREGIEDGRIVDPASRRAMLEIKGRKGQLGLEDVRQLHGWMWTAIENERWEGKGIVVANLKLEERPDLRQDLIAPNAERFARDHNIAVVLTTQLYEALRQHQAGSLDYTAFWDRVYNASGLADLPIPPANCPKAPGY
jgi:hypothetical protein